MTSGGKDGRVKWDCVNLRGPTGGVIPDGQGEHVRPTWADAIKESQEQIAWAYERRRGVMQAAYRAGLTLRSIANAAGLSRQAVHSIIGRQTGADQDRLLNSPSVGSGSPDE